MLRAQKLESLGLLAAGVAHDFNNLLVGVLGNAELVVQDKLLSTRTRQFVDQVIEAAGQAAALTRQLLAYTGRGHFSMCDIDMGVHVSELGSLLRASLPKTIKFTAELAPALPAVRADPEQLQQVTMNLILNAAEAYEGREGEVRVRTLLEEIERPPAHAFVMLGPLRPGRYVVFEVSDSGCGLEVDSIERIFEPFFSTKFMGRGLGLAAVLGIARGHGAVLSVDSALGVGTTFRVYFPVSEGAACAPSTAPKPQVDLAPNPGILVVDDDARVRCVVRAMLETAQMRVFEAENGEQAIVFFERHGSEVDALLLDLIMPGPDAASVLRALRQLRPSLPVVIYSGLPEDATRLLNDLDRERSAFLEKPFSLAALVGKLRAVLGG
jgi:CheY-like chemotaxis protein